MEKKKEATQVRDIKKPREKKFTFSDKFVIILI